MNKSEDKRIGKILNKSYLKSEGILKKIYEYEYMYHIDPDNDKKQMYSDSAHEFKEDLLKELDSFEGVMSMNLRGRHDLRPPPNNVPIKMNVNLNNIKSSQTRQKRARNTMNSLVNGLMNINIKQSKKTRKRSRNNTV